MRKAHVRLLSLVLLAVLSYSAVVISTGKPSTPQPLTLYERNIVTAEPSGLKIHARLRVWGYNTETQTYENIWTVEGISYSSVAIGNVDRNDTDREIVAVTRRKIRVGSKSYHEIYFHVYKEGVSGVWKESPGVEDPTYWFSEVTISDLDEDGLNEIVMVTERHLVVYRYNCDTEEFEIVCSWNSSTFAEEHLGAQEELHLQSVTVGDVNSTSSGVEILVSGYVLRRIDSTPVKENKGFVFVFNKDAGLIAWTGVEAYLEDQTLRVGDLDNDGYLEICSTGSVKIGTDEQEYYQSYILVWNRKLELIVKYMVFETTEEPWTHLDVGELNSTYPGEEIALGSADPDLIILYGFSEEENNLVEYKRLELDYYRVTINNVYIADSDGDGSNEVVVSGYGSEETQGTYGRSGRFYLEVFSAALSSEWRRIGGERGEMEVWYAAIG